MIRLNINFATDNYSKSAISRVIVLAFLCLMVVYSWHNINSYTKNREQIIQYQEKVAAMEQNSLVWINRFNMSDISEKDLKLLKRDVEFISNAIPRETFSWTELLSNLEEYVPRNVFLTQISPDFNKKKIKIVGVAKTMKDMLSLVDNLNRSSYFTNALLLKHSEDKNKTFHLSASSSKKDIMLFHISAEYRMDNG
jgi:hypothetical protein